MVQVRWDDTFALLGCHGVAASAYLTVLLGVPAAIVGMVLFLMTIAMLVGGGGEVGPMVFPILLAAGVFYVYYGILGGFTFFLVTAGIQFLKRWLKISWWMPMILALAVALATPLLLGDDYIVISLLGFVGFGTYWLSLSASEAILNWIRRKLGREQG